MGKIYRKIQFILPKSYPSPVEQQLDHLLSIGYKNSSMARKLRPTDRGGAGEGEVEYLRNAYLLSKVKNKIRNF